ncbi:MAG: aldehyde dehydrogenase (NADP(+)) [Acidobacteria bacterium]|nr:aldehyde dehydrogenase (NADP(+)) [Acidobacteriota bacterium]
MPSATGEQHFESVNPATGATGDVTYTDATPMEIHAAVHAASQIATADSRFNREQRATFLENVARELMDLGEPLLAVADWETALGRTRLASERDRTIHQLRMFAADVREGSYVDAIIDTAEPQRRPVPRPDLRRMLFPIGPVAVFGAGNFPLAFGVCGGDSAAAWAAGCPVIYKAHPSQPQTSELCGQAVLGAMKTQGLPGGWFSLLHGADDAVGRELVRQPELEAVSFTGSLAGGRALFDEAAARPRPIPVFAEMGSLNPLFVTPGSLTMRSTRLAEDLAASVLLGMGQFCTKPGLLVVPDMPVTDDMIDAMIRHMEQHPGGPLLNRRIRDNLRRSLDSTLATGDVTCLTGGTVPDEPGWRFRPALLQTTAAHFLADDVLLAEHFGPVGLLIRCPDMTAMADVARRLGGQLTATIHIAAGETGLIRPLLDILQRKAGRIIFNGVPTGVEVCAAMMHGGPYPASSQAQASSVGITAVRRFLRPVAFQNTPPELLPGLLQNENPAGILRLVNGEYTRKPLPE